MRGRTSPWVWWSAFVAISTVGAALRLTQRGPMAERAAPSTQVALLVAFAVFATVGALILSRRPRHPIGRIYLGGALAAAAGTLTTALVDIDRAAPGNFGGAGFVWLVDDLLSDLPLVTLVALPLLLFPDGSVPSRRWRPVFGVAVACLALIGARSFVPGHFDHPADIAPANPLGIPGAKSILEELSITAVFVLALIVGAAIVNLFLRFRRAKGAERQQLKWLGWAGVWALVLLFMSGPGTFSGMFGATVSNLLYIFVPYFFAAAFALIPLATAVAILRYRLYDIDRIVSRAVAYVLITGVLLGAYLGLVVLLELATRPFTKGSDVAVAASTLVVAAVFRPVRRRIQNVIDHRFNRARYDAGEAIDLFTSRLRDEVDIDTLSADLQTLVHHTMEPAHMSLWMRGGEDDR